MSFDALAPHYRWMEFLAAGNKLQHCRTFFLNRVRHAENVLILGEGNGRFLVECRRALSKAHITCVDASARMLAQASKRVLRSDAGLERCEFIHADALDWNPPEAAFDLIVTHFFLDCFRPDQLELLTGKLARAAQPGAVWLLADFQCPGGIVSRARAQLILFAMHLFFRLATRLPARRLTPPDALLQKHGFILRDRVVTDWGLLHSDLWEREN